jgi:hypothetical protein
MIRILILALTLAACASPGARAPLRNDVADERREDAVKRMQDEFNQLFPDG